LLYLSCDLFEHPSPAVNILVSVILNLFSEVTNVMLNRIWLFSTLQISASVSRHTHEHAGSTRSAVRSRVLKDLSLDN
jgi:hypothetical protein